MRKTPKTVQNSPVSLFTGLGVLTVIGVALVIAVFSSQSESFDTRSRAAGVTPTLAYKLCDLNRDARVNTTDKALFDQYYAAKNALVDFNKNGIVDTTDYSLFTSCYLSSKPTPTPTPLCRISGCSGEVCQSSSLPPINTNCIYRPEYACLKQFSSCTKQSSGKCGWSQTSAYLNCLTATPTRVPPTRTPTPTRIPPTKMPTPTSRPPTQTSTPTRPPPPPTITRTPTPTPFPSASWGLTVVQYKDANWSDFTSKGISNEILFDWGLGSPMTEMPVDGFSIAYSGTVLAPYTGSFTIYITADDQATMTFGGQTVTATAGNPKSISGQLTLGTRYPITIKYVDYAGPASIKLEWSGPYIARQVISRSYLYYDNQ